MPYDGQDNKDSENKQCIELRDYIKSICKTNCVQLYEIDVKAILLLARKLDQKQIDAILVTALYNNGSSADSIVVALSKCPECKGILENYFDASRFFPPADLLRNMHETLIRINTRKRHDEHGKPTMPRDKYVLNDPELKRLKLTRHR